MIWLVFFWFYILIGIGAAIEATENQPPSKLVFIFDILIWPCVVGYAISRRA